MKTIEQMTQELLGINFFIGGLTDEGIIYYHAKMTQEGKIK